MPKRISTPQELLDRLLGPPDANGCREWGGAIATERGGYGMTRVGGRRGRYIKAHQLAWEVAHGPVPPGMFVLHTCDNPPCAERTHLFLGTADDNAKDMVAKGRQTRGERNPAAVLSETQVIEIRNSYKEGARQSDLARQFSVSPATICMIVKGQRWTHV